MEKYLLYGCRVAVADCAEHTEISMPDNYWCDGLNADCFNGSSARPDLRFMCLLNQQPSAVTHEFGGKDEK